MLKRFFEFLEELFGGSLIGAEGVDFYQEHEEQEEQWQDEPLDCTGFYLSNTETNYGKSHFHRYK
jgi:hypothetical protein